ncbi:molybdate ABC transporter permease subunit [Flavitalea sp. BT771]|uniref:molybdate ABC transporter permease subunit n=1 Tax=Flavitalea sp. BT771 TaxID=3063329 RepID=UPI0026E1D419|nr:molybdate ABC transporter permease subunit [Flavitalea sp. BT771]MDO6432314.1 molybdate ABC transporter permease subunit [Flavitalea sp. BT771]MDV6221224.1 molybdate ABC transporter permease subunit [Flavitalea sp. BT771]
MTDWQPLWLSFRLASITTVILLAISLPLAYWLAYSRRRIKAVIEALISLPMVLPPSVLGFYLLVAFSPSHGLGMFLDKWLDIRLVFTFPGLVVASLFYSLPFMVNPLLSGFKSLPPALREASYTLGKSKLTTLIKILLPNIRSSLLTGIVLSFAHTIGEFGVVLMIGGNIPGQTRVASLAIFDEMESMNYSAANRYALILFLLSFIILAVVYLVNHYFSKPQPLT